MDGEESIYGGQAQEDCTRAHAGWGGAHAAPEAVFTGDSSGGKFIPIGNTTHPIRI